MRGLIEPAYRLAKGIVNLIRARQIRPFYFAPPGHFYSPIPDSRSLPDPEALSRTTSIEGVCLNTAAQLETLRAISGLNPPVTLPAEPESGRRYHASNGFFGLGDATMLAGLMRIARSKRLIEVGSGYSSAMMLDTDEAAGVDTHFTFIDPDPSRLHRLLTRDDLNRHEILASPVQDVPVERFLSLAANDILFIDSSHVVKTGSDVLYLFNEIVPRLAPGVLVEVHDIPWPFEYPLEWFREGRCFNEAYFLRAFLQHNDAFEIVAFNSYLHACHTEVFREHLPDCETSPGTSLWIRKK